MAWAARVRVWSVTESLPGSSRCSSAARGAHLDPHLGQHSANFVARNSFAAFDLGHALRQMPVEIGLVLPGPVLPSPVLLGPALFGVENVDSVVDQLGGPGVAA